MSLASRLQELGIYNDYYYRLEVKTLEQVLSVDEVVNCVLTGLVDGSRRMVCITDSRIIIVSKHLTSNGDVLIIKRKAVTEYQFIKKFLFSKIVIKYSDKEILIRNTQGKIKKLFEYAMNYKIKEYDK